MSLLNQEDLRESPFRVIISPSFMLIFTSCAHLTMNASNATGTVMKVHGSTKKG